MLLSQDKTLKNPKINSAVCSMWDKGYRYGFNAGSEKDDEIAGSGNYFTTEFREGDTRLGRWWSTDPEEVEMPWQSSYCLMDNNPVLKNDPNGDIVPIILGIWAVAEIAMTAYDVYEAGSTLTNKNATTGQKWATAGGLALGALLPGGGYGTIAKQGVKQVEKKLVKETAGQIEKKVVNKAEQLAKNKAQGAAKEKVVKTQLEKELKPNEELLEQATHKISDGKNSRPDFTVVDKEKKTVVKIVDAKSGNSPKTPNQKALEQKGGTLIGKKAGPYKGTTTPPTKIEIR